MNTWLWTASLVMSRSPRASFCERNDGGNGAAAKKL